MSMGEPTQPDVPRSIGQPVLPSFIPPHALTGLGTTPGGGVVFQNSWGGIDWARGEVHNQGNRGDAVSYGTPGRELAAAVAATQHVNRETIRPSEGSMLGAQAAIQLVRAGILPARDLMSELGITPQRAEPRVNAARAPLLNEATLERIRPWGIPVSHEELRQAYANPNELREGYALAGQREREFMAEVLQEPAPTTEPIYAQSRRELPVPATEGAQRWFLTCVSELCLNYYAEHNVSPNFLVVGPYWSRIAGAPACRRELKAHFDLALMLRSEGDTDDENRLCFVFATALNTLQYGQSPADLRRHRPEREPDCMGFRADDEPAAETQYHRRLSLRPVEPQQVTPQP